MKCDRQTLPIAAIREENSSLRTFTFHSKLKAEPGQFIMLTIFSQGEKPFSILDVDEKSFSMTIKNMGPFTDRLFQMKVGELVSVRGPYGQSFNRQSGSILMVGGGFATPPLRFLAKKLREDGVTRLVNINGARSAEDLLYVDDFEILCHQSHIATDDGSLGHKGTSVDVMEKVLQDESFDQIYISGPEKMMKAAVAVAKKHQLPYEVNLERYMKCGVGVCGSCVMDPTGFILCMEGPIVDNRTLDSLEDFGTAHRGKTGRKTAL
ncbi:MAG: dihydroorotate dehydrogenase electron transfer subunit [Candidatus Marinimicrobia bacterium]|nr:dihydroorotate dehydrogenase electron transfer subunit [Candidatus Neomarinimicrobiota bacterium]MBT4359638.1 dihydroorotate dehydrogenase electron transfer subunit [Candidatus Neomarinimicrobiota bacterium]MBT4713617.1 dihydroorotate dehydrogenase electron transfer subunit [Candidatus Neomarinimicrobiota bacterium]MBT4947104.1 dihydroorotate dehydrogenase electron transfer subunit [Candidatus Neomarinimicrobiota bacterium]MBT5271376.1 dihydroorotate dehydrogenase electron transfer subunit [